MKQRKKRQRTQEKGVRRRCKTEQQRGEDVENNTENEEVNLLGKTQKICPVLCIQLPMVRPYHARPVRGPLVRERTKVYVHKVKKRSVLLPVSLHQSRDYAQGEGRASSARCCTGLADVCLLSWPRCGMPDMGMLSLRFWDGMAPFSCWGSQPGCGRAAGTCSRSSRPRSRPWGSRVRSGRSRRSCSTCCRSRSRLSHKVSISFFLCLCLL